MMQKWRIAIKIRRYADEWREEITINIPCNYLSLSFSVDMWSLYAFGWNGQREIIYKGDNEKQQLAFAMELLGKPLKGLVSHSAKTDQFFDQLCFESGAQLQRLPYLKKASSS